METRYCCECGIKMVEWWVPYYNRYTEPRCADCADYAEKDGSWQSVGAYINEEGEQVINE